MHRSRINELQAAAIFFCTSHRHLLVGLSRETEDEIEIRFVMACKVRLVVTYVSRF